MAGHRRAKNGVALLTYVPATHVFTKSKRWMTGTRPGAA
jgi:hypothetical protein